MVHHSCRKLYGDNCFFADSSWKRYQRAHSGDTLIFNFGNTCCGGHGGYNSGCCGGGNFWSNFGAGFGLGLANLCSGFLNGLMSPFSMMGGWMSPFSMMGGWMSSFNMMGGWMSPFGMSDCSPMYIGGGNKTDKTAKTDAKPLAKPAKKVKSNDSNDEWEKISINDADKKKLTDAGITFADYEKLKEEGIEVDNIVKLKEKDFDVDDIIKLKSVPASDVIGFKEAIKNITAEEIVTLHGIGVKKVALTGYTTSQPAVGLGLPTKITKDHLDKLKTIANKHSIPVACGHNDKDTVDQWVAGKIDDITETDGKISFTIDCKNVGQAGGKYKFTQKEKNSTEYTETPVTSQTLRTGWRYNNTSVTFTFEQGKDYMETTGKVATKE
ncbi:MAG: hypothetical protein MJ230_01010 [bacterium]|nr:hypothetical protein [bacterium]